MLLQEFAQASRQCNGDVDTELLREGFMLVDQLRKEEQEANPEAASQQDGSSMSDSLEQALLAQVAVDHFDEAMKYLSAMPNGPGKLNAQLRVIDALRQAY